MEDGLREFLVTKFFCHDCGSILRVSYGKNAPRPDNRCSVDEPTGSKMVSQPVIVHPCSECLRPAKEIAAAVKTLISATED